jgi:hypothetical protein
MTYFVFGFGLIILPVLFRLALRLRLGIPMVYAIIVPTVFRSWYLANTALADGIFFALVGLMVLSWLVTLAKKFVGILA